MDNNCRLVNNRIMLGSSLFKVNMDHKAVSYLRVTDPPLEYVSFSFIFSKIFIRALSFSFYKNNRGTKILVDIELLLFKIFVFNFYNVLREIHFEGGAFKTWSLKASSRSIGNINRCPRIFLFDIRETKEVDVFPLKIISCVKSLRVFRFSKGMVATCPVRHKQSFS